MTDQCSDCAHCHGVEIKVDFDGPGYMEEECDMESVMTAEELRKYQYGGVNIRLADDQMERLISVLEKHNTIKVGDEDIPIQEAEDMLAEAKIRFYPF